MIKTKEAVPRKGRPRIEDKGKSFEALKPWRAKGMSRRTWYSRRKEAAEYEELVEARAKAAVAKASVEWVERPSYRKRKEAKEQAYPPGATKRQVPVPDCPCDMCRDLRRKEKEQEK